jgi:cytochrome c553
MRVGNHKTRRGPASLAVAAMLLISGAALAEEAKVTANVSEGRDIFTKGKGGIPPCMSCHGEKGLGIDAMQTPKLANDGYAYIVKQLTNFAEDTRTDTTQGVMNLFAKQLTEQDRRNLAAYVNTLEPTTEPSDLAALKAAGTPVGDRARGEVLVRYGVVGKAPACQSCHGYNGRGADPIYPSIGGQKYVYLTNQLKKWRDGSRANDPLGQMRAVAKNLSDDDIADAAAYLTLAPKSTIGDGFVPENESVLKHVVLVK